MKISKRIIIIIILFVININIVTTTVEAIGFASSMGTKDHISDGGLLSTVDLITKSANYYLGLRIFAK